MHHIENDKPETDPYSNVLLNGSKWMFGFKRAEITCKTASLSGLQIVSSTDIVLS